jgi:hypothetical protein
LARNCPQFPPLREPPYGRLCGQSWNERALARRLGANVFTTLVIEMPAYTFAIHCLPVMSLIPEESITQNMNSRGRYHGLGDVSSPHVLGGGGRLILTCCDVSLQNVGPCRRIRHWRCSWRQLWDASLASGSLYILMLLHEVTQQKGLYQSKHNTSSVPLSL